MFTDGQSIIQAGDRILKDREFLPRLSHRPFITTVFQKVQLELQHLQQFLRIAFHEVLPIP